MSKYTRYDRQESFVERQQRSSVHPVWRGFGFIYMIGVPIFSYFLSEALILENKTQKWVHIPSKFLVNFSDEYILVKIVLTLLLSLLLFAILSFVGVFFFQLGGHQRYGPLDAPPEPGRPRKKL